jgi:competence protein CoiA
MMYAYSSSGEKIGATPGAIALCPECGSEVIAKCGSILVWHWAHMRNLDCDQWGEGETFWHYQWKQLFPPECVEVVIERDGVIHRADIVTPAGTVIELQHSPLSPYDIAERETFYQNMIWVFDVSEPYQDRRLLFRCKSDYYTFRWKHPRKHLATVTKRAYWDFGDTAQLFRMHAMHIQGMCGGWGVMGNRSDFIAALRGKCGEPQPKNGEPMVNLKP